jgi:hypothetical protein
MSSNKYIEEKSFILQQNDHFKQVHGKEWISVGLRGLAINFHFVEVFIISDDFETYLDYNNSKVYLNPNFYAITRLHNMTDVDKFPISNDYYNYIRRRLVEISLELKDVFEIDNIIKAYDAKLSNCMWLYHDLHNVERDRNNIIVKYGKDKWTSFAFDLVKEDKNNLYLFIEKIDTEVYIRGIKLHPIFSVITRLRSILPLSNSKIKEYRKELMSQSFNITEPSEIGNLIKEYDNMVGSVHTGSPRSELNIKTDSPLRQDILPVLAGSCQDDTSLISKILTNIEIYEIS